MRHCSTSLMPGSMSLVACSLAGGSRDLPRRPDLQIETVELFDEQDESKAVAFQHRHCHSWHRSKTGEKLTQIGRSAWSVVMLQRGDSPRLLRWDQSRNHRILVQTIHGQVDIWRCGVALKGSFGYTRPDSVSCHWKSHRLHARPVLA